MITLNDILLLSPEIVLTIGAFVVIIVDLFYSKKSFSAVITSLFLAIYMRLIELESAYCIKNNVILTNRFNITSDIYYENINSLLMKNYSILVH